MNLKNSLIWVGIGCSLGILITLLIMSYVYDQCHQLWFAAFIVILIYSLIAPVLNQKTENPLSSFNLTLLISSLHLDTLIYIWLFTPCRVSESGFQWKYVIFTGLVSFIGNLINQKFHEES